MHPCATRILSSLGIQRKEEDEPGGDGVYLSEIEPVDGSKMPEAVADEYQDAISFYSMQEEGTRSPSPSREAAENRSVFLDSRAAEEQCGWRKRLSPTLTTAITSSDSSNGVGACSSLANVDGAMSVSMSLCGKASRDFSLLENRAKFQECLVTYDVLCANPTLFNDPNLVVCCSGKFYSWQVRE